MAKQNEVFKKLATGANRNNRQTTHEKNTQRQEPTKLKRHTQKERVQSQSPYGMVVPRPHKIAFLKQLVHERDITNTRQEFRNFATILKRRSKNCGSTALEECSTRLDFCIYTHVSDAPHESVDC